MSAAAPAQLRETHTGVDRRLSNILADPTVRGSELSALVQVLTLFHHTARRGPEIDRAGTPEELRRRWRRLLHSLAGQSADIIEPAQLARIDELAMRYIDGRNPLLANRIAVRHLEQAAVRLVLVGGLPGTGKSTVATNLAIATGAVVIASDHVRKQLLAGHELTGSIGTYGAGAYAPAGKARVYAEMLSKARALLGSGVSVILDASWIDATERQRAAALAEEAHADLVELRCVCPRAVASGRIRQRAVCESDATPDIAVAIADATVAWPDAITLDTTWPPDHTAAAVRAWLRTEPQDQGTYVTDPAYLRHAEPDRSVG
ncbi:AAA family ATPase [Nocardia sp. NBC_00565]|uniref:AAA family ATPase n=1 Tax=Nocardia sp. NBC_00565 TaxID=2975993 RepID=UPI002E81CF4B|nr:AAA family ATPase [Nocardia sp. NBC_00565]WUC06450.1 AAA family ATPase [Nocardia sp. NBC_00565]